MRSGNILIGVGAGVVVLGLLVRFGLFGWFGHLPGDIRIEGARTSVFVPITSMIVVSVVGSIILSVAARLFRGD